MSKLNKLSFKECKCEKCQDACRHKPGWFMPGEVKCLAKYMGITLKALFEKYLSVDWYVGHPDIFVLSPSIVAIGSMYAGTMFPGDPRGVCVFFEPKTGKCGIHSEYKPLECKEYYHEKQRGNSPTNHSGVAEAWNTKENQQQIKDLLGKEPKSVFYFGGL